MQFLKVFNMILAFLVELCMFFSIAYWGFQQGKSPVTKWGIAIGCTLLAITLWGILAAPNAQTRLSFPYRLFFELFMFLLAAYLLYTLNFRLASLILAVIAIISVTIAYFFKQ